MSTISTSNQGTRKRRILWLLLWVFLGLSVVLVIRGCYAFRDRTPGYELRLNKGGRQTSKDSGPLRAGFARVNINPDLSDPKYPIYLAGFNQNRVATGIHDDLWAIACVIENADRRLGIMALDAIGFFHEDVVRVRQRLAAELKLDYVVICSTHNHSTPDLLGLWGPNYLHTGVDNRYREQVRAACVRALSNAVSQLQPARVAFHEIPTPPQNLVADTRRPEVFDPDIRVMHFVQASNLQTLGTIVGWADHPETVWANNTEVTSDFCGYVRAALENGVTVNGQKVAEGLGGIHLYINGAVGGLMSTTPETTVHDPYSDKDYKAASHEKARAVGHQLASRILPRLRDTQAAFFGQLPLGIHARTLEVPLNNKAYLLAGHLGLLDRGHLRWRTLRTEVALLTLGDASLACVPGEI
ncbi:MAG TPA: neutral/alkaline non-lysosomal ceramidase N-terminal domain-containing protein, partial [Bacillota bacterium]|nr:neutral/alkaline non-lysosomal ceramidase N-terminal domain-containing protein [Bacillota bacterium]